MSNLTKSNLKKTQTRWIAPSILSADFSNFQSEIEKIQLASADLIHVDVMDGHFVPNITIGMPVVASLKSISNIPLDVHLMIEHPEKYIAEFIKAGSHYLTIHVESTMEVEKCLNQIRSLGGKPGITARPGTSLELIKPFLHLVDLVLIMTVEPGFGGQSFMPDQLQKIEQLNNLRQLNNFKYLIEVDGGINPDTALLCWNAGADILVAGSAVFKGEKTVQNYSNNIKLLK